MGFPYPIALTLFHMIFCSTLSWACMTCGLAKPLPVTYDIYVYRILPIAACYAGALWCVVCLMIRGGLPALLAVSKPSF